MAVEILMPELGESVHEGTVSRWLKKVGEFVQEDEPVVEIMTDKVNTELPSPASGILTRILVQEGEPVEVFHAMGVIEEDERAAQAALDSAPPPAEEPIKPVTKRPEISSPQIAAPTPAAHQQGRRWYTPVVRSIAKANQLSEEILASIPGTGSGGRVTKRDVESFLASGKSVEAKPAGGGTTTTLTGMRKMIADAMIRANSVPTVSTLTEIDVTPLVTFREKNKDDFLARNGVKLTFTPFFIKAITEALLEFPVLNSSLQDDKITHHASVHMGVAVALGTKGDEGLIVPVIRNCETKSLIELAKELETIASKARSNKLAVADVQGGTFTLTNPGSYGAILGTPMINAPQAAIGGAYAIKKMPVVIGDMIGIRSIMNFVLTYDHRIIDGLMAGRFLQSIKSKLENFDFLK